MELMNTLQGKRYKKDSNCTLNSLSLCYNKFTDEGVKYLAEALKDSNCKPNSLNLARNKLTDEGVKYLAEALKDSKCNITLWQPPFKR